MYEELISELREEAEWAKANEWETPIMLSNYLTKAADAIEELQAGEKKFLHNISALETENENLKRARRWIPVEERMPQEREWVLCQCRAKIRMVLRLQNGYWHQDSRHEFMSGFVTHWMPLPEPPKEET